MKNKVNLYDVCFFGSITNYRQSVLKELHRRKINIKVLGAEPPFVRDELLRMSKINLSIRANENTMSHIPHFRILTALYHNTMTITEYAKGQEWLEPMMTYVEPNIIGLVNMVEQVLNEGTYEQKAMEYKGVFQSRPMVDIMRGIAEGTVDLTAVFRHNGMSDMEHLEQPLIAIILQRLKEMFLSHRTLLLVIASANNLTFDGRVNVRTRGNTKPDSLSTFDVEGERSYP